MATQYDLTIKDFEAGDRVEAHPATNSWISGDRFGTVEKVGVKYVHVLMDKSEKVKKFIPENLGKLSNTDVVAESQSFIGEFNFGYNEHLPLPEVPTPAPAQVFNVDGTKISTRSSVPWKRKLAKKLARKVK